MVNTTDAAYNLSRVFQIYIEYLHMDASKRIRVGSFDRFLSSHMLLGAGDQLVKKGTFLYSLAQPLNLIRDTFQGEKDTDTRRRELVMECVQAFDLGVQSLENRRYKKQAAKLKGIVSGDMAEKEFDRLWSHLRVELKVFAKDLHTLRQDIRRKGELFHRQLSKEKILRRKDDINDLEVLFRLITHTGEQQKDRDTLHALHNELVEVLSARGMGLRGQEDSQTLISAGDLLGDLAEVYAAGLKADFSLPPNKKMKDELAWGLSESSFLSLMVAVSHHARKLEVIDIDGRSFKNKLKNSAMSALADVLKNNPRLQVLDLRYHEVSGNGIMQLVRGIPKAHRLEAIILRGNPIGNRGATYLASAIKDLELLTLFDVARCRIGDEGANALGDALAGLSLLNHVNFRRNRIEESGCIGLASLIASNKVESLRIGRNSLGDLGAHTLAEALSQNRHLESLDLQHCDISNQGSQALEEALKSRKVKLDLDLKGNQIESDPQHSKIEIHQLRQDLSDLLDDSGAMEEVDQIIQAIQNLGQEQVEKASKIRLMLVQTLSEILQQSRLNKETGGGDPRLAQNLLYHTYISNHHSPMIRSVLGDGEDPSTPAEFTDLLEGLIRKERLLVGNSGVALLAPMMKKGWILRLHLAKQGIGPEGGRQLAIGILGARNLAELRLESNPLGYAGISAMGTALVSNSSVRRLHIDDCGMNMKGMEDFASGLAVNHTVRHLELEEEGLEDAAVALLLKAIRANKRLKKLFLKKVELGPLAAEALRDLLQGNKEIETVSIEGSDLNLEEAQVIAEGLAQNKALKELHFPSCGLEDKVALVLDKALRTHPALELFNVSENAISAEGQTLILVGSGNRYFKSF